jgi:hypothetical protein
MTDEIPLADIPPRDDSTTAGSSGYSGPGSDLGRITVVRDADKLRLRVFRQTRLRNDLLLGVGLLEIANACDFAANVWNQTPPPLFARVLMGIGGAVALFMITFAVWDGVRSWKNVKRLRLECQHLRALKLDHQQREHSHSND